ncbi:Eco57I restriction-modification methylase domain-containing protein [Polaribacter uvawellassae]|uniref:Eco57I restriction-modification methylase domain-containing protein n=1 Tax=Polaribacter uvawellassae TaxID=3133495 RepID=UPI003219F063
MAENNQLDIQLLEELIIGRVEPHIYAFTTGTIPNYLKVGDTYRPVETRLNEWRKHFPELEKKFQEVAKIDEETFFRDFAVHKYLENDIQKSRLLRDSLESIPYYSNEFFKDTTPKNLDDAIIDIKESHNNNDTKYQLYKFEDSHIPIVHTYNRTETYEPRPNQKETIERFTDALNKGRNNLLMYAVMRFGKSFTSMCCAVEMNAKIVLIVSAKADVREEWKKTVESHKKFDGFTFLDSNSLLQSDSIIKEKIEANENIALFLTLQDLQGDDIKTKHKEVFENQIDLLLIDETHFGARALEYGKVLKDFSTKERKNEEKLNDESIDQLDDTTKTINAKVRIHLSGTPYRILMNSEFTNDDIIAFYQFTNIAEDQENWNEQNLIKDEIKEWDNPYYGFPQMIRFAFNPNKSSRQRMEELKKAGITYAFSELLKPKSILKDNTNQLHKKFIYEQEIIDLLNVIDGKDEDDNLLSFLDYDKLTEGKMCRHMVCVLPYRASCDALEELIKSNEFKNLSSYEVINISGVENDKIYKDTQSVKTKITKCESENKKTITLTVNRMLTGSTVPEWDTMLYLKDTASPQEYDQAIFRLQSQFIKVYKEPDGDIVKYNMKPQTLLVDFNPNRVFQMQEQKSQIYNVNVESNGNTELEERIKRELQISPIIVINNKKMVEVEPTDILDAVRKYSNERSVLDEATSISIDFSLLDIEAIKAVIEKQGGLKSRQGLEIEPSEGEGDDIDTGEKPGKKDESDKKGKDSKTSKGDEKIDYKGKFAMYYARILFFSFLTDSKVKSLQEIINTINEDENNLRIASNLNLEIDILSLFQEHINPFILSELDYKISNINSLANDNTISQIERASNAMKKFSRLSDSEIITPEIVTDKMMNSFPTDSINESTFLLDIASKQGEFVYATYKKFGKEVANKFYSIPTSKIAYEFTRKVYKLLELDIENIESNYTSYDLIKENDLIEDETIKINNNNMKFDVIVGNPPYQRSQESTSDKPIYQDFMEISYGLASYVSLITPARFLFNAGKTPKSWNNKMLKDQHFKVVWYSNDSSKVFPNVDIKGGLAITLRDKNQNFGSIGTFTPYTEVKSVLKKVLANNFSSLSDLVFAPESYRLSKKLHLDFPKLESRLSKGHKYDLTTNIFDKLQETFIDDRPKIDAEFIQILGRQNNNRVLKWVKKEYVDEHKNLDYYKLVLPKSNGTGKFGEKLSTPLICKPNEGHNQTFISIGAYNTEIEANNLLKYIKTKFSRLLLGTLKVTQDNKKSVWKNIPIQNFTSDSDIDWSKSIEEIDKQLYRKYKLSKEEIEFIEKMIKPM